MRFYNICGYWSLITGAKVELTGLVRQAKQSRWASWSLVRGLQQLTDTMADAVTNTKGGEIRTESQCLGIHLKDDGKALVSVNVLVFQFM